MSQIIDQPRNDVPIVADATLLAVPNINDEAARTEYLKKIRALRDQPSEQATAPAAAPAAKPAFVEDAEVSEEVTEDATEPELESQDYAEVEDSEPAEVAAEPSDTRIRLSEDDLRDYLIPVKTDDGTVQYLSYDEFNKTIGTYNKQNKRARELAEREREVEALKTNLVQQNASVLQQAQTAESKLAERYIWIQNSLEHAAQHNVEIVHFEDGTERRVTQLIAEKTALENAYNKLQARKAEAKQYLDSSREDFLRKQDEVLDKRAPNLKKNRAEISKFLERQGFTPQESNALAHAKAELLLVLDKAMRYERAQQGQPKEKRVGKNTHVIQHPSRLAGRGTSVNQPAQNRAAEIRAKGTRATADELRELRRLTK